MFVVITLKITFFSKVRTSSPSVHFSNSTCCSRAGLVSVGMVKALKLARSSMTTVGRISKMRGTRNTCNASMVYKRNRGRGMLRIRTISRAVGQVSIARKGTPRGDKRVFLSYVFTRDGKCGINSRVALGRNKSDRLLGGASCAIMNLKRDPLCVSCGHKGSALNSNRIGKFTCILPRSFSRRICARVCIRTRKTRSLVDCASTCSSLVRQIRRRIRKVRTRQYRIECSRVMRRTGSGLTSTERRLRSNGGRTSRGLTSTEGRLRSNRGGLGSNGGRCGSNGGGLTSTGGRLRSKGTQLTSTGGRLRSNESRLTDTGRRVTDNETRVTSTGRRLGTK